MPIRPGHFPPLQERSTGAIIWSMIAFLVIGLIVAVAGVALGGWLGWLGFAFALFVVVNAQWVGIQELRRRKRSARQ